MVGSVREFRRLQASPFRPLHRDHKLAGTAGKLRLAQHRRGRPAGRQVWLVQLPLQVVKAFERPRVQPDRQQVEPVWAAAGVPAADKPADCTEGRKHTADGYGHTRMH